VKKVVWVVLTAAAFGCLPVMVLAADSAVYDVPRLEGVAVDGSAEDWEDRGFGVEMMYDERSDTPASDFEPVFRLGWDENGLLFMARVRDDVLSLEAPPSLGDSAAITLAAQPGAPGYYRAVARVGVVPDGIELRVDLGDNRVGADEMEELAAEFAGLRTEDGYAIEGRLPWKNLAIKPEVGGRLAFIVWFNDVDEEGGRKTRFAWPQKAGRDTSVMNWLRLAEEAGPPVVLSAAGGYKKFKHAEVDVYGAARLVGKEVALKRGDERVAGARLAEKDGRAAAELRVTLPPGEGLGMVNAVVEGYRAAAVHLPDFDVERGRWLLEAPIVFEPYCFAGDKLPDCDFEQPGLAEQVIGPYRIKTAYYDANFDEVAEAVEPGRYGAVVEITPEKGGRTIRRLRTLYRFPEEIEWWTLESKASLGWPEEVYEKMGLEPAIVAQESEAIKGFVNWRMVEGLSRKHEGAELLAGMSQLKPRPTPKPTGTTGAKNRQWWVTFKRKYYGSEKRYPGRFFCPRPIEGESAPAIREGTLEEAGMKADAAEKIDAALQEWAEGSDEAFAVCIVRHGVIVLHKAYGMRDGKPMGLTTRSWMASLTKLMSGTLMMMLVDQGLVDLDERVDKYLPALRGIEVETPLTVRHLYTHTNGFWGHWGDGDHDLEELIAGFYPHLEVGKRYEYNGVGFALGGKIIETVSGEAIPMFYVHHLLDPLGCKNTRVFGTSGDAASVPLDMAKIGQMLLNKGAYGEMRFFSEETFRKMLPERLTKVLGPGATNVYGIGTTWFEQGFGDGTFGHGAASNAILRIDPTNDMVVVMTRDDAGKDFGKYVERFFQAVIEGLGD